MIPEVFVGPNEAYDGLIVIVLLTYFLKFPERWVVSEDVFRLRDDSQTDIISLSYCPSLIVRSVSVH